MERIRANTCQNHQICHVFCFRSRTRGTFPNSSRDGGNATNSGGNEMAPAKISHPNRQLCRCRRGQKYHGAQKTQDNGPPPPLAQMQRSSGSISLLTCSIPRFPLRYHSLVCIENCLFIVGIGPIINKEIKLIFRSDRSDRTCVYS